MGLSMFVAAVACAFGPASVAAQGSFVHTSQAGDTLASVAQRYYEDPSLASVLQSENRIAEDAPLAPGTKITVPYTLQHRAIAGETWDGLALRYYGDADRVFVLLQENRARRRKSIDVGAVVRVPYALNAEVRRGESANDVAKRFGVKRGRDRRWVGKFNPGVRFRSGDRVLVPLASLSLSEQGRAEVARLSGKLPGRDAHERQLAASKSLVQLREHGLRGAFPEVLSLGNKLLGGGALSDPQKLTVLRELANAYAAFGRQDLATKMFIAALVLEPNLSLDPVQASPKLVAALEAARRRR